MIIKVQYKSKWSDKPWGAAYTYRCDLEDIEVGECVIAPTKYGAKEAFVAEVGIAECEVPLTVLPELKTITRRREEPAYV